MLDELQPDYIPCYDCILFSVENGCIKLDKEKCPIIKEIEEEIENVLGL